MPVPSIDYETAERQTLDEIRDWHHGVVEALISQRATVIDAIRAGLPVVDRFVGLSEAGIDDYFDAQRQELNRLRTLNLVASAEAEITIDYFRRLSGKLKDTLSRAYRNWHLTLSSKKQLRPDFDEDGILSLLKDANVMDNNVIGRYRECLKSRHWLGHGRRWNKPAVIDQLDTDDVYIRCKSLVEALPT